MSIASINICWVDEGVYLGIQLIARKHFKTDWRKGKKIVVAVNNVMYIGYYMSEECIMEILCKQCMPVLMYASGVSSYSAKDTRRVGVSLNRSI